MTQQKLPPITVLLIDDNAFSRKLTRTMLVQSGLKDVVEASSGEQGIAKARELKPDLVIVDWVMPGLNGAATIRGLKDLADTGYAPGILVTSTIAVRTAIVEAARLGALGFIVKPFAMSTLRSRLERVMSVAGLGQLTNGSEHRNGYETT